MCSGSSVVIRKKFFIPVFAFLFSVFVAFICEAKEVEGSLMPKEVFVGDTAVYSYVEKNIPESFFSDSPVTIPSGNIFEPSSSVTVKNICIVPMGDVYSCRITFIPWETGEIFLPRFFIEKDKDLKSSSVSINVSSLSGKYGITSISEDRPPMLVPGTFYILYALIFLLVVFSAVFIFLIRKIFFTSAEKKAALSLAKAGKLFSKRSKKLKKEINSTEPSVWYEQFSLILRLFFYEVTGNEKYLASDARDFSATIGILQNVNTEGEKMPSHETIFSGLKTALYEIEKIRFSAGFAEEDKRQEHLTLLERFIPMFVSSPVFYGQLENKFENIPERRGG